MYCFIFKKELYEVLTVFMDSDSLPGQDGSGWLEWHIVAYCAPHSASKGVVNTEPNILRMVVSEVQNTNWFHNM